MAECPHFLLFTFFLKWFEKKQFQIDFFCKFDIQLQAGNSVQVNNCETKKVRRRNELVETDIQQTTEIYPQRLMNENENEF